MRGRHSRVAASVLAATLGAPAGAAKGESFTSQVVFDDTLVASIFAAHPDYKGYGQPDTTNATDGIVTGSPAPFTLATARMSDGAMLASKQLICQV